VTTVVIIAIVVAIVVSGAFAFVRISRRRPVDGVESFRRHIDALSPEARREVIDRVQNARDTGKGK
jgi:hypothetical protein